MRFVYESWQQRLQAEYEKMWREREYRMAHLYQRGAQESHAWLRGAAQRRALYARVLREEA